MTAVRHLAAAVALGAALAAQERKLGPRSFFPTDYQNEAFVDVQGLIDHGIFDVVARSPLRALLAEFRNRWGFDLEDVQRARYAQRVEDARPGGEGSEPAATRRRIGVWVLEGGEAVSLHKVDRAQVEERKAGGHVWLEADRLEVTAPCEGTVVIGEGGIVARILRGEETGGVASSDLTALTATPRTLAYVAAILPPPEQRTFELSPMPKEWFSAEDPPTAVRLRLGTCEAAADRLQLELFLQFASGESGPTSFERSVREALATLGEQRQLRTVAEIVAGAQVLCEGREAVVVLELGTASQAANALTTLALAIVPASVRVQSVDRVTVPAEAPPPEPRAGK